MNLKKIINNIDQKKLLGPAGWAPLRPAVHQEDRPHMLSPAAVLVALYQQEDEIYFPLIKRVEDGLPHSGQIALPGGRLKTEESAQDAAIRETREEIGLVTHVNIVKALTPLPIAVSKYIIHPFIGMIDSPPSLNPSENEVSEIILVKLSDLLDDNNIKNELWHIHNYPYVIPFFDLYGHKVWGATAMILSEFRSLLI